MERKTASVKLLGTPEIRVNGCPVKFPFRQAEAMVYYLSVSGPVSRDHLCDVLWGDRSAREKAKASLRNTCYVIRNRIGRDFLVERNHQMIELNRSDYDLDVDAEVYLLPGDGLGSCETFLGISF